MVDALQQLLPGFLIPYLDWLMQLGQDFFGSAWADILTVVWTVIKVVLIIAPLLLIIAYVTFCERKVIGWMQVRIGPNRVGPWGLIQPLADGLKLMLDKHFRLIRGPLSVPFVIRETKRKFQHTLSEVSLWERC